MSRIQLPTVLVVEDDDAMRAELAGYLSRSGWDVEVARDATEALALLASCSFDVVSSDMDMPGGTGLQVLNQARREWPDIKLVMLSGNEAPAAAARALGGEFFMKPGVRAYKDRMESLRVWLDERCDCEACMSSGEPCHGDCDHGEECEGCLESREAARDAEFDADVAAGRR